MGLSKPIKVLYRVLVAFLVLVILLALVENDFSLWRVYRNARVAARSVLYELRFYYKYYTAETMHEKYEFFWNPANYKATGVTRHDRERSYEGLTFFTNQTTQAFLIDMEGKVVHKWELPFSSVWPNPTQARMFEPDKLVYWRHGWLFPSGDVILICEGPIQVPYAVGIVKLNKDSEVIWKSGVNAHHDLDIDEDGNIYVLKLDYVKHKDSGVPFIRDGIAVLSPEGKTIKEVDLYGKIVDAGLNKLLGFTPIDPLHVNNIELLRPEMADRFPMFDKGDILISAREPSAILVLDGKTFDPKWHMQGVFKYQHDPDFLSSGLIRVFDNQGNMGKPGGASRLVDIDPATGKIAWQYTGTAEEPFVTMRRGAHQQLPNGNILITESRKGRLFEITPEGETVWEYISPSYDGTSIGILSYAMRYNRKDLSFLTE